MPWRALDPTLAAAAPATTIGQPLTNVGETLLSLREELLLELGARTDITQTGNARVHKWINWAYRNLAGMLKIRELKGSVSFSFGVDQPFQLLPAAVGWVNKVGVIDEATYAEGGRKLLPMDEYQYRRLPDEDAEPTHFFVYHNMLVFYPDPITIRTGVIDFKIRPVDLSAETDSPILPIEYHEGLLLMARHRAFRSLRNYKEAAVAMNDALQVIRPLRDPAAEEQSDLPAGFQIVKHSRDLIRIGRTVEEDIG